MNILITTSTFAEFDKTPLELLHQQGFKIRLNPYGSKLNSNQVKELYKVDVDGVIAGTENITASIFEQADSLKTVARVGVGIDAIDLEAAKKKGVEISTSKGFVDDAVAELALAQILNCLRQIPFMNSHMKDGLWQKKMGRLLKGKALGILGCGNIGERLIKITQPFDLKYLVCDVKQKQELKNAFSVEYVDLESLLSQADILSVHLPLFEETRGILDYSKLSLLKSSAFLINTSRAEVVVEKDLLKVIQENKIAGAALDVFEEEPYSGALSKCNNVIVTPHVGSYARESRVMMEKQAVENLICSLKRRK